MAIGFRLSSCNWRTLQELDAPSFHYVDLQLRANPDSSDNASFFSWQAIIGAGSGPWLCRVSSYGQTLDGRTWSGILSAPAPPKAAVPPRRKENLCAGPL
jgi:hypothetical protein